VNVLKMEDLDLAGRRVLIREDLNVPVKDGVVTSDARIHAALPTLQAALTWGGRTKARTREPSRNSLWLPWRRG
jgi:phosphoglycerate kinase